MEEFALDRITVCTSSRDECDAEPIFCISDCARDRTEIDRELARDRDEEEPECEFVREFDPDREPLPPLRCCDNELAR